MARHAFRRARVRMLGLSVVLLALPSALAAGSPGDDAPSAKRNAKQTSESGLLGFISRMPELINQSLPMLQPGGAYWIYGRPSFGNPLKGGFFRLNLGAWFKVNDRLSLNLGTHSYVWRDRGENDATRYGFYGVNGGVKYDRPMSGPPGSAMSLGVDYSTPVSRPPLALTDGYRHLQPHISFSRPLNPKTSLVGFLTIGADFLNRSALPSHFGINQLHADSAGFSVGASRPWKHFSASLTLNGATTVLFSHSGRQVFSLNPQIYLPLFPGRIRFARITLVLGARATIGPDGRQFSSGASVHWDFRSRPYTDNQ